MTIQDFVSRDMQPLRLNATIEDALGLFMELRVRHLPVVDDQGIFMGIVSEDQLLEAAGPAALVGSLPGLSSVSVYPDTHLFDVTRTMMQHGLTTLPVASEDRQYLGLVQQSDIFDQFARMLSTQEQGAILILEEDARDYSLSKLVYTIEQNDVKILSISSEPVYGSDSIIRITLKLNVTDATRVRHMLEHYGYHVVAAYGESEGNDDIIYRVQEFMRYLEV